MLWRDNQAVSIVGGQKRKVPRNINKPDCDPTQVLLGGASAIEFGAWSNVDRTGTLPLLDRLP